ncbi:hypothetical protein [Klebsiella quasipneumoniae]|uniref:hypothetical protein n=1 Tax=Klebsiella quasipneumoniae TaxID=1463165 RepID=UPI0019100F8B|nr:hypothetical protein [Klebsiella quasipneumoniae]
MTDITELAQRLKLEVHRAVSDFNPQMNIKTRDLKELVEALEKAQAKIIELQQGYEIDPRTHEIIDLQERIAELESRDVKLPPCVDDLHGIGMVMSADAVIEALASAGIKVEVE